MRDALDKKNICQMQKYNKKIFLHAGCTTWFSLLHHMALVSDKKHWIYKINSIVYVFEKSNRTKI